MSTPVFPLKMGKKAKNYKWIDHHKDWNLLTVLLYALFRTDCYQ